jgi:CubicO group peptidase (beta-lactamase class C family)
MGGLQVEVEAGEVGFESERLARIGTHFAKYVEDGRLPGWLIAVMRGGKVAYAATCGYRDVEESLPVEFETIFRAYSMTKPVTSVAAMMLHEEGAFELNEPVAKYIPAFRDTRVFRAGSSQNPSTDPQVDPMRIWHLMTHTSGLTYGFLYGHPVDAMYRAAGYEWGTPAGIDLATACDTWASLPLLFQPGTEWNYSVATDVLGRIVEILSGQSLDRFFAERIFEPLEMVDTAFGTPEHHRSRLASLYVPNPTTGKAMKFRRDDDVSHGVPTFLSGGGGLMTTASDYLRFCEMLRRGGELDETRILGSRTVRYMTQNHLPGRADLEQFGRPLFAETTFDGVGFGLGFSVVDDPVKNKVPSSAGEFAWGGAASTAFWIDPVDHITVVFFTQLLPSSTHPIRSQLKQLVSQALVD